MCTAISLDGKHHLFGRTLDVDRPYGEEIIVVPRNHTLAFRHESPKGTHPGLIGIGCVRNGIPLFFDAINESGLYAAGLNFPISAKYHPFASGKHNIASFEFITWILSECETLYAAKELLKNTNITDDIFSNELSPTPLHWLIADKSGSIAVESLPDGLKIHENKFGVLTNEPPFEYHSAHIADFIQLTPDAPKNIICPEQEIMPYSRGMGAIGLPGDFSSASRFVRAFFVKTHCEAISENDEINRFFHVTDSVSVPFGCVKNENGKNMYTRYASCADTENSCYYFTTYNCRKIRFVKADNNFFDSKDLSVVPLDSSQEIMTV